MMLNVILAKIAVPALILVGGAVAGIGIQQKVFNPDPVQAVECPDCNCPQPQVSVQPFDVDKIKNLKTFTYSPGFTGSISVAGVDSSSIKRYIDDAVMKAFAKHVKPLPVVADPPAPNKRRARK